MDKNRVIGLDYLRIFACFLVVLYHVPHCVHYEGIEFNDPFSHGLYTAMFFIGRLAVPLFFIISGFLLFPCRDSFLPFIYRRLGRVLIPTLFWIIVFSLVGTPLDEGIVDLPYIQRCQHLWYMFALIGVYLTIPLVSPWFRNASRKEVLVVVGLWVVTLLYPAIYQQTPIRLEFTHQGMLYSTPFHSLLSFSGYFGYVLVGGVIKKYFDIIKENRNKLVIFFLLVAIVSLVLSLFIQVPLEDAYAYLSLPTAFVSISSFIFFATRHWNKNNKHVIEISNLTFGVYLLHPLLLEQINITFLGGYTRLLIAILIFVISLLIIKLLSLLPFSKYIIG